MSDKASILIVDDRPEKILSLEVVLETLGAEIVRAYSGREALRHVLTREFAVILLDVNMPGMDGFETASTIRQRRQSEHVPIIFVTAVDDEMHAARGYSLGAVDYILAPVVPDVLRSKVGVFVDLYHKNHQLKTQAEWLRRRASQLQKLAAASVAVNACQSIEGTLRTLAETARDIVGCRQSISLFLGDPRVLPARRDGRTEGAARLASASYSDDLAPAWAGKPLDFDLLAETLTAKSRVPVRMTAAEMQVHPDHEALRSLGSPAVSRGILTAPLLGREGTHLGMLRLADRVDGDFSADDEAILLQLAQIGAVTVENVLFANEREANRLKDEFLATLSHELRTPLHAMYGWTQLLRMEKLPDDVAHGLEVIERNVNAQSKLIEDLLDVSRITTGKLRISRRHVSLAGVVRAAVESARPVAAEKKIHLDASIDPAPEVSGDSDRLQQVIWNLLSNAIKFTPPDGTVSIALEGAARDGTAEIRVSDTGVGIDPMFLPFIFDRFRQADSTSTRRHGGLGIGLTIVRHIVELHGGTVHAMSAGEGNGSTFVVRLPLLGRASPTPEAGADPSRAKDPSPAHINGSASHPSPGHPDPTSRPSGDLANTSVLLVEDEADARALLGEVLRRSGADVVCAGSAAEAIQSLSGNRRFDILVSDIAMPGEDGYSLIARVRASDFPSANAPAIAVTAYAREEDRARALAAGFNDHLPKPVSPAALVDAVVQNLQRDAFLAESR